ncbi:MAG: hypothetical protein ABIA74_06160 [bacterium]
MKKLFFLLALSLMISGNVLRAAETDEKEEAKSFFKTIASFVKSGTVTVFSGGKALIFNKYTFYISTGVGTGYVVYDLYNHPEHICELLIWAQANSPVLLLPLTNLIAENEWLKEYVCGFGVEIVE